MNKPEIECELGAELLEFEQLLREIQPASVQLEATAIWAAAYPVLSTKVTTHQEVQLTGRNPVRPKWIAALATAWFTGALAGATAFWLLSSATGIRLESTVAAVSDRAADSISAGPFEQRSSENADLERSSKVVIKSSGFQQAIDLETWLDQQTLTVLTSYHDDVAKSVHITRALPANSSEKADGSSENITTAVDSDSFVDPPAVNRRTLMRELVQ